MYQFISLVLNLLFSKLDSRCFKWLSNKMRGFPGGSLVKNLLANAGDTGSIPGLERFPGEGNGNPLQYLA